MNSTYLVTGANRGIGLEWVRQLARAGHSVIATARVPEEAAQLRAFAGAGSSGEVRIETLDVGSQDSVDALAARLEGEAIDTLINNAAISGHASSLLEADDDSYRRCFEINSLGPLRVSLALLDPLRAGRDKRIVNISSQLGSMTLNTGGGYPPYRLSKAALNMVTRSLAAEHGGEGFTCVSFHPGWVKTDMGGGQAPLTTEQSVSGMLEVLTRVCAADNGKFFDYTGKTLPW